MANGKSEFKYYHYDPTLIGAVIFIVLFLLTTSLHVYQLSRTRTWFMIPLIIGGFFEWIGYTGRAIGHVQTPNWTHGPYLIQTLFLLVAPALFAASIYMILGRIILLTEGESQALIEKKWLTKIFVAGDVLSFLLQGAGGGIEGGKTSKDQSTGAHIITGGLILQLLFFSIFIVTSIHFHLSLHKTPTPNSSSPASPWHKHLFALYISSSLIMIRSILRVVEYVQGFNVYILGHEVFLYVFDAVLMFFVMVVFNVVHPSEVVALIGGGNVVVKGFKMEKVEGGLRGDGVGDNVGVESESSV